MVYTFDQIKDERLECSQVNSSISHRGDPDIPILNLHASDRIDDQEDIAVASQQVQSSLLDADMCLTAIDNDCVASKRTEMSIYFIS